MDMALLRDHDQLAIAGQHRSRGSRNGALPDDLERIAQVLESHDVARAAGIDDRAGLAEYLGVHLADVLPFHAQVARSRARTPLGPGSSIFVTSDS